MAHREGVPRTAASKSRLSGCLHVLCSGGHFQSLEEAFRAKSGLPLLSKALSDADRREVSFWELPC